MEASAGATRICNGSGGRRRILAQHPRIATVLADEVRDTVGGVPLFLAKAAELGARDAVVKGCPAQDASLAAVRRQPNRDAMWATIAASSARLPFSSGSLIAIAARSRSSTPVLFLTA